MRLNLRYLGQSTVHSLAGGARGLSFAPNLARPKVFFDAELQRPLRFREAMSALHAVVVGDQRPPDRDRAQWEAHKASQLEQEQQLRRTVSQAASREKLEALAGRPMPKNLERDFRKAHGTYWRKRRRWASDLWQNDPELWRHLVPCDPVVTVADDVVFFEAFSKDESSYGMLVVDREAFGGNASSGTGTTNVDYSQALYEHIQTLRTYRPTRLKVDPTGFEVAVQSRADHREEKIDLPPTWLRGFGQIQAATCLPARHVPLSVEAVHGLLTFLKRHREKHGPRAVRFELVPGHAPKLVLEPWNKVITSHGTVYAGPKPETIKIWGRRRLEALARTLPLATGFDVQLLGTGLPSVWVANLGEMRFQLALSGWTANDWTSGANLQALAGAATASLGTMDALRRLFAQRPAATWAELTHTGLGTDPLRAGLFQLAQEGQLVYDFGAQRYRARSVMPAALTPDLLGPEAPEVAEGKRLAQTDAVLFERLEPLGRGRQLFVAHVQGTRCEAMLDDTGVMSKARCACSWYYKNRLRKGPCRHLLAARLRAPSAPDVLGAPT
jgi:hypothetical protein